MLLTEYGGSERKNNNNEHQTINKKYNVNVNVTDYSIKTQNMVLRMVNPVFS